MNMFPKMESSEELIRKVREETAKEILGKLSKMYVESKGLRDLITSIPDLIEALKKEYGV